MSTKTHSAVDELNDLERTIIESALSYNGLIDVPTAAHEAGLEETKAREILVCLLDRDIMTVSDGLYEVRDRRKFEAALNNSSPGAPATIEHVKPTPPKPIEVKSYANLPDLVEDLKLQGAEPRQMITAAEEQGLGNSLSIRYYLAFSAANPELYNSRVSPEHESSGYGDHHDSEDEPERKLVMFLLYMSEKHGIGLHLVSESQLVDRGFTRDDITSYVKKGLATKPTNPDLGRWTTSLTENGRQLLKTYSVK